MTRLWDDDLPKHCKESFKQALADIEGDKSAGWQLPHEIPLMFPEGLVGEIAQFIYESAPRPSRDIAIAGAIGLMAGICGRAYNVSGTGLNHYLLVLALTGTGKEAIATSSEKLMKEVMRTVPAAGDFLGPAEIASGQALLKYVADKSPCFVSIIGEFGMKLQQLASPKASPHDIMLKRVILDLFNKSGKDKVLRASIYADKDKNTKCITSPAVTLLGESTPETFYGALSEDLITDGLLPRFTVIEYRGKRPRLNKKHDSVRPSNNLVESLSTLAAHCLDLMHKKYVIDVEYEQAAETSLDLLDEIATDKINAANEEVIRHLWNRAHIKTLKLAALVAVGVNPYKPVITESIARWAYFLVKQDIENISERFRKGEFGMNHLERRQMEDAKRVIIEFFTKSYAEVEKYGVLLSMHINGVIPYAYIQRRLASLSAFRNDRQNAGVAIKRTIETMIETGEIRQVNPMQMRNEFDKHGKAYIVCEPKVFLRGYKDA